METENSKKGIEEIFKAKREFHKKHSSLSTEEKIKILIHLQKIGKLANPEKTKGKRVWDIDL